MAEPRDREDAAAAPQRVGPVPMAAAPGAPAPPAAPPLLERPKDGKLTRAHMEETIRSGGSVMHQGRVIDKVEDLPSAADLAEGDREKQAALASSLDTQIQALVAQKAALTSQAATTAEPGKGTDAGHAGVVPKGR